MFVIICVVVRLAYFSTMTGLILTISLLTAFQGEAGLQVHASTAYYSIIQRNANSMERLLAKIPVPSSPRTSTARITVAPLSSYWLPNPKIETNTVLQSSVERPQLATLLLSKPIRGPDSL
jgi:hypothetical protein